MTSSPSRLLSLASRILFALTIAVFVGYLVIFFIYALALLRFPYDYDQGEGFELNDSILFSRGEWPYRDNEAFPFYASNYGPVFHLLALPLFPIFGPTLAAGRFLSFLATIAIGVTVTVVVERRTRDRPIAVEHEHGASAPDMLEVARQVVLQLGYFGLFHMAMLAIS